MREQQRQAASARKKAGTAADDTVDGGGDGHAGWDLGYGATGVGQWGIIDLG